MLLGFLIRIIQQICMIVIGSYCSWIGAKQGREVAQYGPCFLAGKRYRKLQWTSRAKRCCLLYGLIICIITLQFLGPLVYTLSSKAWELKKGSPTFSPLANPSILLITIYKYRASENDEAYVVLNLGFVGQPAAFDQAQYHSPFVHFFFGL